jgi:hypothetical protein
MPKKKVISMLEFLRTGSFGGISCGMTLDDFHREFGKADFVWFPPEFDQIGYTGVDSLEIVFHKATNIICRIKLRWLSFKSKKKYGSFLKITHPSHRVPRIARAKIDPWVIRENLEVHTFLRFLKSAKLNFFHSQWRFGQVDQIELESGVILLFDPPDEDSPGLGHLEISDKTWRDLHKLPIPAQ